MHSMSDGGVEHMCYRVRCSELQPQPMEARRIRRLSKRCMGVADTNETKLSHRYRERGLLAEWM